MALRKLAYSAILIGFLLLGAGGSVASQADAPKVQLLLVDETQTLQASILVQVLAQTLIRTGLFELQAKIVNVQSSFDDPLGPNPTDKQYELILIIPRGLEDGSLREIWMVTKPITFGTRPELLTAIQTIKSLIEQGTEGRLKAIGVMDDFAPAWFAAIFAWHGWLQ
ncbi:MAG: hypothetical protein A2Z21_10490 [Candidatus Fraserbacteria bacterium RBG_16_55_9]|uniref:Uncharacterized protein n=1 Tax=Fraserbacteria sp. (strain RBG_16_55_9) TaxID=1817864 RepID=A0A1F5UZR0_FRAXR|nr:MAG: hypothetical protein A2Z21_10490 [Candidatus Fraserbacteria bacterium RBG_16_55_9]